MCLSYNKSSLTKTERTEMKNLINNEAPAVYSTESTSSPTDKLVAKALAALEKDFKANPLFSLKDTQFVSPDSTISYLTMKLCNEEFENFDALFLDNQNRLIEHKRLFTGTIDGASVYPRVVAKRALEVNAAAVIFAHNHPSGDTTPSSADKVITQKLKQALDLLDIRVLDHIIVGGLNTCSFAEEGLI